MESLELSKFSEIKLSDKNLFRKYFFENKKTHNEFNFTTLFSWHERVTYLWTIYKEHLLIYADSADYLYPPIGPGMSPGELKNISDAFRRQGKKGIFSLVDKDYIDNFAFEIHKYFDVVHDRSNSDYIYETQKLVELKGQMLQKKKNLISQFQKNNPNYTVRPMVKEDGPICFELAERWCKVKNCNQLDFSHETSGMRRAFDYFAELEVAGLLLYEGEQLIAFSLYSQQNLQMYSIHYEKFDPEIKGCGQMINWLTAQEIQRLGIPWMNREQDLGLEGLRQAKLSYAPSYLYDTYQLVPLL